MAVNPHEQFNVDLLRTFPTDCPHDLLIAGCDCEECTEIREDFAGYKWIDLPDSIVQRHYSHLSLIEPEAFRYFLPAFLKAALADPDSDITEFLMYALAPSGIETSELAKFSDVQRRLVVRYLDLIASDDELRQEKVWKKTCARWTPA